MKTQKVDKVFLSILVILVAFGFLIFASAALGLLAGDNLEFSRIALNQVFFGLVLGGAAAYILSRIEYRIFRRYAFYLLLFSLGVTALVFVPALGFSSGGATRWLHFGNFTFQPAELLKLGFVVYFAAWLSGVKEKVAMWQYGLAPLLVLSAAAGAVLLLQPDTGTFMVIFAAGLAMFVAAGGPWRHVLYLALLASVSVGAMAFYNPYVMSRITTFINPAAVDPLGAGFQIQQSLIAVGSGGVFGRGFGQSIQKFGSLPEPIGDSIFAVFSEEFGFAGAVALVLIFIFFALRGLKIASQSRDSFGLLLSVGIITLIVSQSFVNMGSMLGILPLTGIPLLFVSHGGSAMLFALAEAGIVLNISKYRKMGKS